MNLERSAEQLELQATVRRLLADHAPVATARAALVDPWVPDRAWSELEALGAMALLTPEGGLVDATVVAEELGRVAYPGPWVESIATGDARTVLLGADVLSPAL